MHTGTGVYCAPQRPPEKTWHSPGRPLGGTLARLVRGEQDPYDTYEWLESVHAHGLKARYFFYWQIADRTIDPWTGGNRACGLVKRLAQSADMGIHPGVASLDSSDAERLKAEISRMKGLSMCPSNTLILYLLQRTGFMAALGSRWYPT